MLLPRRRHLLVLLSDARLLLILLSVSRVGRGAWTGRGAASSSAARAAPLCAEGNALSRAVGDVHGGKYNFDPTYSFGRDDGTSGTRATRLSLLYPTGELAATTALQCFGDASGYEEYTHDLFADGANANDTGALATIRISVQQLDEPIIITKTPTSTRRRIISITSHQKNGASYSLWRKRIAVESLLGLPDMTALREAKRSAPEKATRPNA